MQIKLISIIFFLFCVRRYGSFSRGATTKLEHDHLLASLSEEDRATVKEEGPYYFAGYDAPFKLFNRRNEIWLESRSELKSDTKPTRTNDEEISNYVGSCYWGDNRSKQSLLVDSTTIINSLSLAQMSSNTMMR